MFKPIKIMDINISSPEEIKDGLHGLDNYQRLKAFIRQDNISIGYIDVPVVNGFVSNETLIDIINKEHYRKISSINPIRKNISHSKNILPLITVAICTRNRVDNLELCLSSLLNLEYPNIEIILIDNAPTSDCTKNFVKNFSSKINYICEPMPGLSHARNRAIKESRGEIIAFTDDDVVVDKFWLNEITNVFLDEPDTIAVTGLVVPYELETYPQQLFEIYGGFGRGFERKTYKWAPSNKEKASKYFGGTGKCGTGANMAFRRKIFSEIGYFNTSLGAGTPTNGGEDLEYFFRIIKSGFLLIYEPNAVVRHRHRKSYQELKNQISNNGIGLYSYITHALFTYKDDRAQFFYLAIWWFFYWDLKRLVLSFKEAQIFPRDLIIAELKGSFLGPFRYFKSKKIASRLVEQKNPAYPLNLNLQKEPLKPS